MEPWNRINEPEREVLDAETRKRIQRRETVKTWLWWAFKVICFIAIINVAIDWSNEWHRHQYLKEAETKLQIGEETSDSINTGSAHVAECKECGAKWLVMPDGEILSELDKDENPVPFGTNHCHHITTGINAETDREYAPTFGPNGGAFQEPAG